MDRQLTVDQARQQDASQQPVVVGSAGVARLRSESAMTDRPVGRIEDVTVGDEERLHRQLAETWCVPSGVIGWLSVVDHKTIGRRYVITAFGFFIFAGILAALMRIQLAVPNNHFL